MSKMKKISALMALVQDYRDAVAAVRTQEKKMIEVAGDRMVNYTDDRGTRYINSRYHNPKYDRLRDDVRKLEAKLGRAAVSFAKSREPAVVRKPRAA